MTEALERTARLLQQSPVPPVPGQMALGTESDTCPCGHGWIDHWLPAPHPCKQCPCIGWWDRRPAGATDADASK